MVRVDVCAENLQNGNVHLLIHEKSSSTASSSIIGRGARQGHAISSKLFALDFTRLSAIPGTFLGDSEKQREELDLFKQTTSLWSHLNTPQAIGAVLSPLYEPNQGIIWPSVAPMSLAFWEGENTMDVQLTTAATLAEAWSPPGNACTPAGFPLFPFSS